MKFNIRNAAAVLSAFGLVALSGAAMATNGYFTHGVGTESKGMAGTGIGSNAASGPIIVASNPALAVFADDSWEVGLSIFSPLRSYEIGPSFAMGQQGAFSLGNGSGGSWDSSSNAFPIPYVAKNWRLSNGNAVTFAFYGRGGMNTDWDDSDQFAMLDPDGPLGPAPVDAYPGTYGAGEAGVDLSQAFLAINYAGMAGDNFAWGIGPVFAVQMFEAKGLMNFAGFTNSYVTSGFTQFPENLTNNGHDTSTGVGASVGLWWAMGDTASVGLSYQSKIGMGEFKDYSDLYAEDGGFDIPSSLKFGISFAGMNNARLNFDIEHTQFSEVNSVGNPQSGLFSCVGGDVESCLGGKTGAGFGWDDMTTYKMGIEWTASDTTVWRFGYSYGEQPIHPDDVVFNILAPGVMEQHITFGFTKKKSNGGAWNVSFMYAPENSVKGVNPFDGQTVEIEMKQFEFEVSYLW
jgi:long-chain fatty acid transport protein